MVKQVMVVNAKIPFPVTRLGVQANHASVKAVMGQGAWESKERFVMDGVSSHVHAWLNGECTKVHCKEWGEAPLLALYAKAKSAGLPVGIMYDDGFLTAIAIGPAFNTEIDPITRELCLL